MDNLRQISAVRQDDDTLKKIWFHCQCADLYIWQAPVGDDIHRFEFYYDKPHAEQACLWQKSSGLSLRKLDDGESVSGRARTPILGKDSLLIKDVILSKFNRVNRELPADLTQFISAQIQAAR